MTPILATIACEVERSVVYVDVEGCSDDGDEAVWIRDGLGVKSN